MCPPSHSHTASFWLGYNRSKHSVTLSFKLRSLQEHCADALTILCTLACPGISWA